MTDRSPARGVELDAMLEDLETLVMVESPSLDVEALRASAHVVASMLERRLGGQATLVESETGPHVRWSGGGEPQVLVLGHHDTVFPIGTTARRPFRVADGRATGPGVYDMLGGLVQAVHGLASLDDRSGVEILMTADEEVGALTSRALIEERALACGAVLVAEGATEDGALKIGRKGGGTLRLTIAGKASHAGLEPEAGVNALVEAAHQVLALSELGRPELETTVTPTMASAGTAANVVPAAASVVVDVRITSVAEGERVDAAIAELQPRLPGATLTIEGAIDRPPMDGSVAGELFAMSEALLPGVRAARVGGGSDGNFTAALGVPTLDGLGAVGGGAHAEHEYLEVDAMVERATLVAGLVGILQAR